MPRDSTGGCRLGYGAYLWCLAEAGVFGLGHVGAGARLRAVRVFCVRKLLVGKGNDWESLKGKEGRIH